MTKRYKRAVVFYSLVTLFLLFVVFNLNDTSTTPFFTRDKLPIKTNQNSFSHEFVKNLTCDKFIDGQATPDDIQMLNKKWNYSDEFFFKNLNKLGNDCESIKQFFDFNMAPLSDEEAQFPLAYGMIVYKNLAQLYFTMSAIYHPQNAYCIALDGKSSEDFQNGVKKLAQCFPNITVIPEPKIRWCSRAVLESLLDCFQHLTYSNHTWKYFQYYSGFDLPLKTNLEMVRIFKQLNGTVIGEATIGGKLHSTSRINNDTMLPIRKSSMAAIVSREAANEALKNISNHKIIDQAIGHIYNKAGSVYKCCADELFWATVFGNKQIMPIEGAYNAEEILKNKLLNSYFSMIWSQNISLLPQTLEDPYQLEHYQISRYQVWAGKKSICKGKYKASSCVYGLGDLPRIVKRAELAAHKFHMDVQPAAYFCLWKHVKDRAFDPNQQLFQGFNYQNLPHVQLNKGRTVDSLIKEYRNKTKVPK